MYKRVKGKIMRVQYRRKYITVGIGLVCLLYIWNGASITEDVCTNDKCEDNIIKFHQTNFVNKSTKRVLVWTKLFLRDWANDVSNTMRLSTHNCSVTTNRHEIETVDAVLFNYLDLYSWETVPTSRRRDQVWIMYNSEPPPHLHFTGFSWKNVFNWTFSYRADSTIHSPYGAFFPLTSAEKLSMSELYRRRNLLSGKTRMVVAAISDCADDARRYRYLHELGKYVAIDYFGKCGNLSCPHGPNAECDSNVYKFRIAFENSNCKDYVTEKFWKSLELNSIPIVNWKKDQEIKVPAYSYINIHDFNSAKDLGAYLNMLSGNATLYKAYFKWKTEYNARNFGCLFSVVYLCDALHSPREAQTIIDPNKWIRTDSCNKWPTGLIQRYFDRFMFDLGF